METVNYYLLQAAIAYLEIAEAENGQPLDLDPNDESLMKRSFEAHVRPEVNRWSPVRRERLKKSLAYFLYRPVVLRDEVLANVQDLTMSEPADIRQFFVWLYESLFPDERLRDVDISNVSEDNDIMQINLEPGELA
jgi:hypothetical protein